MDFYHLPVLLEKCMEALSIKPSGTYIDATMGGAGHSEQIVKRLTTGKLIGFDQDKNAIAASRKRLAAYQNVIYVNRNFQYIKEVLGELAIDTVNGALMDLGVSSHQLDEAERGFSYMHDAPLDMRMDQSSSFSAYDVVNSYSREQLEQIIFQYGEERWAKRIAAFIEEERGLRPIETTGELVSIIKKAVPKGARRDGPHPAKRTFQAIRIEVNGELSLLGQAIDDFVDCLKPGGRLAVITFHSLEDRIVKTKLAELAVGCTCPKELPVCVCGKQPKGKVITRKPIVADERELLENPRARSAKLRVFERA